MLLVCLLSLSFAEPLPAAPPPAAPPAAAPLRVGTHPVPPFVLHNPDGSWSGISIDLWDAIAKEAGVTYEIQEYPVPELVSNRADVDVAVSLNITEASEASFDMTHAFLSTGLGIAVREEEASAWDTLRRLLTPATLSLLGGLAALLVAAGSLMWLVERRKNEDAFGDGAWGWVSGLFWAVETVIGYNDPAHQTRAGRALGVLWAAFGVILVSTLTAQISSQLTLSGLSHAVTGPDDLPKVRAGTVQDSAGWRFCLRRGLACRAYPDGAALVEGLARGEIEAAVYEAPILRYLTAAQEAPLSVLPGTFDNHGYGFGLREGSPHREAINRALLRYTATDSYRATLAKYLGAASD